MSKQIHVCPGDGAPYTFNGHGEPPMIYVAPTAKYAALSDIYQDIWRVVRCTSPNVSNPEFFVDARLACYHAVRLHNLMLRIAAAGQQRNAVEGAA